MILYIGNVCLYKCIVHCLISFIIKLVLYSLSYCVTYLSLFYFFSEKICYIFCLCAFLHDFVYAFLKAKLLYNKVLFVSMSCLETEKRIRTGLSYKVLWGALVTAPYLKEIENKLGVVFRFYKLLKTNPTYPS